MRARSWNKSLLGRKEDIQDPHERKWITVWAYTKHLVDEGVNFVHYDRLKSCQTWQEFRLKMIPFQDDVFKMYYDITEHQSMGYSGIK